MANNNCPSWADMMTHREAIEVLDRVIPEQLDKMVDREHLRVALAWKTLREKLLRELDAEKQGNTRMSLADLIINAQSAYLSMNDPAMREADFTADFISGYVGAAGQEEHHAHIVTDWLGDCHCSNCGENADCTKLFCAFCGARFDEPTVTVR